MVLHICKYFDILVILKILKFTGLTGGLMFDVGLYRIYKELIKIFFRTEISIRDKTKKSPCSKRV